jgi:hypothetical protein
MYVKIKDVDGKFNTKIELCRGNWLHPLERMVAGKFLNLLFYETRLYIDVVYFRVAVKWGRHGPKSWRIDYYYYCYHHHHHHFLSQAFSSWYFC